MTRGESIPSAGSGEERRAFHELALGIDYDFMDPYLVNLNNSMAQTDEELYVLGAQGDLTREHKEQIVAQYDRAWPYMRQDVAFDGVLWKPDQQRNKYVKQVVQNQRMESRGFLIIPYPRELGDGIEVVDERIGYLFVAELDDDSDDRTAVIVLPEDSEGIGLPSPSVLARIEKFRRTEPELAELVDELMFTSPREDQTLIELKEFSYYCDFTSMTSFDMLLNAQAFLRAAAGLDTGTTHFMSMGGDVVVVRPDGDGYPTKLAQPYTKPVKLGELTLRPETVTVVKDIVGEQKCIPYIEVTAYEDHATKQILIPVTSLLWVQSARYVRPTAPKLSSN